MDLPETPAPAETPAPLGLERLRLRFRDDTLEAAFRDDRFRHNVGNIRFAFLGGIFLWTAWGLLLQPHILALEDRRLDTIMRFGIFIPLLLIGVGLTFTRFFRRIWQSATVVIASLTLLFWVYYASLVALFGAELTHAYAVTRGSKSSPRSHEKAGEDRGP